MRSARFALAASLVASLVACSSPAPLPASPPPAARWSDNAIWARRVWLHEAHTEEELQAWAAALRARGITTVYPFLGPPNADGQPGWRKNGHHPVDPARAGDFLRRMQAIAPDIAIYPWTGGVLDRPDAPGDVDLTPTPRAQAWQAATLALPAAGVHLNVEPLPESPAFLAFLEDWKAKLGGRTLSVAAYPPPTPLHPFPDVHWSLPFLREVCRIADDVAVMAYDTALPSADAYTALMAEWTAALATLPPPEAGGCTLRIGVPSYNESKPWHDPSAETLQAGIVGLLRGLPTPPPAHIKGVALYASWTTDDTEWAVYDRVLRQRAPASTTPIDVLEPGQ